MSEPRHKRDGTAHAPFPARGVSPLIGKGASANHFCRCPTLSYFGTTVSTVKEGEFFGKLIGRPETEATPNGAMPKRESSWQVSDQVTWIIGRTRDNLTVENRRSARKGCRTSFDQGYWQDEVLGLRFRRFQPSDKDIYRALAEFRQGLPDRR